MYSFTYERKLMRDDREIHVREEKKRAKGVSRVVVQSNIHHEHYKSCLLHRESRMEPMVTFRSFNHQLFTLVLNKTGLSPNDDKRYSLSDSIHTLAHGHHRI